MSSIAVGEEWSAVAVDEVDIILDRRAKAPPIAQFGAFGAGSKTGRYLMPRPSRR